MPRSRSRSIASSTCASISRAWSAPVISRKRSARVDLPWSIWAMTEKFRMCRRSTRSSTEDYDRYVGYDGYVRYDGYMEPSFAGQHPDSSLANIRIQTGPHPGSDWPTSGFNKGSG